MRGEKYVMLQNISNKINSMFQKLFDTDIHPFISDLKRVEEIKEEYNNYIKKIIGDLSIPKSDNIIDFDKFKDISYYKQKKINGLKHRNFFKILKELHNELNNLDNYNNILELVNEIYKQTIPSNVKTKRVFINI